MRLIDADKVKQLFNHDACISTDPYADKDYVRELIDAIPTVDAVDRKLFNKVCEQFTLDDPQWICDEMSDHDDEWEVCKKNCEYNMCQPQCIERYARLLLKMDEVTE